MRTASCCSRGLGVSPSPTVLIGKEGWWYYTDDGALEDIVSADPMPESAMERWRRTLDGNRAWLAGRGIPYLFVMTPDKHAVYPEFLPDTVRPAHGSRTNEVGGSPRARSQVDVLEPAARRCGREGAATGVYHRTDTHWNNRGALVGWLALGGVDGAGAPGLPCSHARRLRIFGGDQERARPPADARHSRIS